MEEFLSRIIPEGSIKNLLRKIWYRKEIEKLNEIDVQDSGTEDNLAWVKIENKDKIWGYKSKNRDRYFYNLLEQENLDRECVSTLRAFLDSYLETEGFDKEKYKTINKGDFVVEIGSFLGHYTRKLSDKVGSSGQLISIEADPSNFEVLRKNVDENNLENITILNKVVGDQGGKAKSDSERRPRARIPEQSKEGKIEFKSLEKILEGYERQVDFLIITVDEDDFHVIKSANLSNIKNLFYTFNFDRSDQDNFNKSSIQEYLEKRGFNVRMEGNVVDLCYASRN